MKPKPRLSKAYTELMKSYKYKAKKRISGLDTDNFWDKFVKERYPEEKCIEVFKCSRVTFIYLIKILRPYISPKQSATPINPSLHMLKGNLSLFEIHVSFYFIYSLYYQHIQYILQFSFF